MKPRTKFRLSSLVDNTNFIDPVGGLRNEDGMLDRGTCGGVGVYVCVYTCSRVGCCSFKVTLREVVHTFWPGAWRAMTELASSNACPNVGMKVTFIG